VLQRFQFESQGQGGQLHYIDRRGAAQTRGNQAVAWLIWRRVIMAL
jgi:hypothetical protein